jgi:alkyl hydroperoxide reductase subunit AhpF
MKKNKTEQIKNICREYKGEVYFNIVLSFECNNTPAVYFERNFFKIVNELNAEVEIDLYAFGGK